jgi:hypothetical protein
MIPAASDPVRNCTSIAQIQRRSCPPRLKNAAKAPDPVAAALAISPAARVFILYGNIDPECAHGIRRAGKNRKNKISEKLIAAN